jgi:hypothetical protein
MDQRPPFPCSRLFLLLILLAPLAASTGCRSALATAIYLVKGTNLPADFDEFRGKRVAVVCRPLVGLSYRDAAVARDLAKEIHKLLAQNVRDIEMVDQRKVTEWIDEHSWEEFNEVGKALDAEYVVGVDLESFSIFQGQTVYQGKANAVLKVFNCQTDDPVFERRLPQVVYPPNSARSTGDQQESEFRREYIRVLADHIARHFYPHDAYADFAMDAASIR